MVPFVFLWYVSFTDYTLGQGWENKNFVGLKNFKKILSGRDDEFWPAVKITIIFLVSAIVFEFIFGLGIAILFDRDIFAKRLWMSLLIIPMTMTKSVIGLMWKLMYNYDYGVLNYILGFFNAEINWLSYENALNSMIITDIWQWTPFVALILYAGLQSLPREPYESAVVDGANSWQIFRFITIPLLKPMIIIALLLRTIDALKIFDKVYVLTRGGPGTATNLLSLHIYRKGFEHTGWIGQSSAIAIMLLFLAVGVCTLYLKSVRKR